MLEGRAGAGIGWSRDLLCRTAVVCVKPAGSRAQANYVLLFVILVKIAPTSNGTHCIQTETLAAINFFLLF